MSSGRMCGIAGAIGRIDPELYDAVLRMSDAQAHRGPDDQGTWSSGGGPGGDSCGHSRGDSRGDLGGDAGAVFAFRRLAILDLSPDGHQPMVDPSTGNAIVFNGEIYNFREIRRELETSGVAIRSSGDTEVLLKAYGRWGLDTLTKLRGMFAFVIWDRVRRIAIAARDRIGIKPLYIASVKRPLGGHARIFASELRAILASALVSRRISKTALSTYLWNGFVIGPDALVEGVQLLPAGSVMTIDAHGTVLSTQRYWSLPPAHLDSDEDTDEARLGQTLNTAMEQHLLSDAPLGVFLSGGIDSSAVAALAVRAKGARTRIRTFNISFDETLYDESKYARKVALLLGTEHTEVRLDQRVFRERLGEALASLDQPTFDAINTYFVSRAAREAGITVALAGTGGDELFGGYKSFVDIPRARRLSGQMRATPDRLKRMIARGAARLKLGRFGEVPPQTRWGKLGDVLATEGRLVELYQVSYGLFTRDFLREVAMTPTEYDGTSLGLPRERARELDEMTRHSPELHAISLLELSCFIGERLLRDTDAASMAVSLEARVPLLDHEVIEAVARVGVKRRFLPLQKKKLLRKLALSFLDPALFDRPKSGFVLPIDVWIRQEIEPELSATFRDGAELRAIGLDPEAVGKLWRSFLAGAPGIYWSRVWSLFVLASWCRRHRVHL